MKTDLSQFNNDWYDPGPLVKRILWMLVSSVFFRHSIAIFPGLKCSLLRIFGAKVGRGVNIKPGVIIKYPWYLIIGNNCWIGEGVWIDNLSKVSIGNNVCISQGALILTGNHDFTRQAFDLRTKSIVLEEGVWIGAKSIVCPGVICESHAVLTVGSVATKNLQSYTINQGNPAVAVKKRVVV